jgi:hypothetical protein
VEEEYHEEKSTSDGGAAKGTGRSAPVIPRQTPRVDAPSTADVDR